MRTTEIDCLDNGAPHAGEARAFHDFFRSLPDHDFVRCYTAFHLFNRTKKLLEGEFDIDDFRACLADATEIAQRLVRGQAPYQDFLAPQAERGSCGPPDVETRTGRLYGALFRDFSDEDYYETSYHILARRFAVNGVRIPVGKRALDDGCGSGRFTLALKRLGFGKVHGVDLSPLNIETAIRRRDARGIECVHYQVANVLALPFPDGSFDFVFCNGVLHHTTQPLEVGLREIHRVLEAGGELFVAVMEKPGGILFDTIELLRDVMKDVPLAFALETFQLLGLRGFRLYSLLDHLMVPVNVRSTPEEMERQIRVAGFRSQRRMTRGLASDQVEKLHALGGSDPEARWKYGVGENKYLCTK